MIINSLQSCGDVMVKPSRNYITFEAIHSALIVGLYLERLWQALLTGDNESKQA